MTIQVLCPKCGHRWAYKGSAVRATCPSCYHKVTVRSIPDPGPQKAPASLRKMAKAAQVQDVPDGQLIQGETREQAGKMILTQTIVSPAAKIPISVLHPRMGFSPEDQSAGHICSHCSREIRALRLGFWVVLDGQRVPMHRPCLVDHAILGSKGDLVRAGQEWDIPLEALANRAGVLRQKGKLHYDSNINEGVL